MDTNVGQSTPFSPIRAWPSGRTIHNRLVKVALYEHLASFLGGPPNERHINLYAEWGKNNWGIIISGNVQVSSDHLTLGRDLVIPQLFNRETLLPFRQLANVMHGLPPDASRSEGDGPLRNQTIALLQLNHAGRQSSNFIGGRLPFKPPLAPSAIRVGSNVNKGLITSLVHKVAFQVPRAMTLEDIHEVISKFTRGAEFACRAGFDGIQLHVAHGYLLSQFLSPKSNHRTELDGFPLDDALELVRLIITFIRDKLPRRFVVSIKLNAADYAPDCKNQESLTHNEQRALEHLLEIARWGMVDIIEISGGDYERPDFMSTAKSAPSRGSRQALFSRFSSQAHQSLQKLQETTGKPVPLLLLTGGLRTSGLVSAVLEDSAADLVGIGRGSVTSPNLPLLLESRLKDRAKWNDAPFNPEPALPNPSILEHGPARWFWDFLPRISLLGAGVEMAWYNVAMKGIAEASAKGTLDDYQPDYGLGGLSVIMKMWFG
ncbi:hypothetical protein CVT24_013154 [Panaeolus cyanescens]|uniref:NADH:flavin oxidoreductase/NADH oxidase N-terminal domain-containing protein n=1 Tax=Panaeolus cyanescens TaxID=181874 RepID=A0A409WA52_9AGAR|nr:hypothetical protein CVT24_013154 [Panaeolus cyanescens]